MTFKGEIEILGWSWKLERMEDKSGLGDWIALR